MPQLYQYTKKYLFITSILKSIKRETRHISNTKCFARSYSCLDHKKQKGVVPEEKKKNQLNIIPKRGISFSATAWFLDVRPAQVDFGRERPGLFLWPFGGNDYQGGCWIWSQFLFLYILPVTIDAQFLGRYILVYSSCHSGTADPDQDQHRQDQGCR